MSLKRCSTTNFNIKRCGASDFKLKACSQCPTAGQFFRFQVSISGFAFCEDTVRTQTVITYYAPQVTYLFCNGIQQSLCPLSYTIAQISQATEITELQQLLLTGAFNKTLVWNGALWQYQDTTTPAVRTRTRNVSTSNNVDTEVINDAYGLTIEFSCSNGQGRLVAWLSIFKVFDSGPFSIAPAMVRNTAFPVAGSGPTLQAGDYYTGICYPNNFQYRTADCLCDNGYLHVSTVPGGDFTTGATCSCEPGGPALSNPIYIAPFDQQRIEQTFSGDIAGGRPRGGGTGILTPL